MYRWPQYRSGRSIRSSRLTQPEPACFLLGYEDIVARIQTLNIWSGVSPKFNCNTATGHLRKITGLSSTDSDPSLHPILRRPEARPRPSSFSPQDKKIPTSHDGTGSATGYFPSSQPNVIEFVLRDSNFPVTQAKTEQNPTPPRAASLPDPITTPRLAKSMALDLAACSLKYMHASHCLNAYAT